jgi:hypothetical protein
MKEFLWRIVAWIVSRPVIANYLISRALLTPYTHLTGYMARYWPFNPYVLGRDARQSLLMARLPSVRVHFIMRADRGRDLHDHPWDARTIILRRGYDETRLVEGRQAFISRLPGDTAPLRYGEYHRITWVPPEGAWTLFITWKYQGTWGFLVDGKKVPHRAYTGEMP